MATRSLNKVMLIGNLTRDPELRYTAGGTSVTTFTVATNRTYTDSSGKTTETAEFTSVVAWAKLGEICAQLLKKGTKVFVEGRLQTSSWETKEGTTAKRTEVVITDMIVLSGNRPGESASHTGEVAEAVEVTEEVDLNAFDVDFEKMVSDAEKTDKKDEKSDTKKSKDEVADDQDSNEVPF